MSNMTGIPVSFQRRGSTDGTFYGAECLLRSLVLKLGYGTESPAGD